MNKILRAAVARIRHIPISLFREGLYRCAVLGVFCFYLVLGFSGSARAQAPANDEPCLATLMPYTGGPCYIPLAGTTVGASSSNVSYTSAAGSCDPIPTVNDVWYYLSFSGGWPTNIDLTFTVTGSSASDVRVFQSQGFLYCSGPQPTLHQIACSRSNGPNQTAPPLVIRPIPSTVLYIRVGGYDANSPPGAFTICRGDTPIPTCQSQPSVNPQQISYTATSATIPYAPNLPVQLLLTGPGGVQTSRISANSPIQLAGLTDNTSYTLSIANICPSGQVSPPTVIPLRTPLASLYCTAALGGNCFANNITSVQILGTPLSHAEGCNGSAAGAYTNVSPAASNRTATLLRGQTYQLRVATSPNPGGGSSVVAAWIDFNGNSIFDAAEFISTGASNPYLATFTVPLNAVPGLAGMRVRSSTQGSFAAADACAAIPGPYGETEDYTLVIDQATAARNAVAAAGITLAPNPARQGQFVVQLPPELSQHPVMATLFNNVGQAVHTQALAPDAAGIRAPFRVPQAAAGVYSLHFTTAAGVVVKRVVLE